MLIGVLLGSESDITGDSSVLQSELGVIGDSSTVLSELVISDDSSSPSSGGRGIETLLRVLICGLPCSFIKAASLLGDRQPWVELSGRLHGASAVG